MISNRIHGRGVLLAFGLVSSPTTTWQAIAASVSSGTWPALRHAALLSLLTAMAWSLGRSWMPGHAGPAMSFLASLFSTFMLCMLAIAVLAGALAALLPAYGCPRNWAGAWIVAAYGATPVLLCGVMLVMPVAVMLLVVTFPYACYLVFLGVRQVLGVNDRFAAEFTAASLVVAVAASMLTGGLLSAAELL